MTLPVLPFTSLYNSALRAIELGDFKKIIAENLDDAGKLDKKALVRLAIALDGVGRRDDAYDVLANWNRLDSDALGTMAGRLKRKWLFSGRDRADAEGAMAHYGKAYELARAGEKSPRSTTTASTLLS